MSKIGIYKPGKKIYFEKNAEDHSAISIEVTRIIEILAENGHAVSILSDNDYIPNSIPGVSREVLEGLDRILVYNGVGLTKAILQDLQRHTLSIDLIVTDMSLIPEDEVLRMFRYIYSQSRNFYIYGAIQEHECYRYMREKFEKNTLLYFGGTERGRTADFIEYVHRPEVLWFGKSATLNIKNYIPYHEHIEHMKSAKYSIVIGDEAYNKNGFVTPRYFECIRYAVIAFVDAKYDPYELMIRKTDFRRVRNYLDVLEKIAFLENNPHSYKKILDQQHAEITENMIKGDNILQGLMSNKFEQPKLF